MIVVCPNCDGKPVLDPFEQKLDTSCFTCGGRGAIDTVRVCQNCGRPATITLFNTPVCRSLACQQELTDLHKKLPITQQDIETGADEMVDSFENYGLFCG